MNLVKELHHIQRRESGILKDLHKIRRQEAQILKDLEELRNRREAFLERLQLESIDRPLTRREVAELLEYTYEYISMMKLPFKGHLISYIELLEWVDKHKPARLERLKKNFRRLYEST